MGCFVPLSEANVAPVCPCICTEPLSSMRRFILDHVVQRCSAASPREAHYESFMPAALTHAACIFNERLLHFINRALKNSNRIDPGWEAPELDCIFAVSPVPLPAAVSLWGLIDTVFPLSSFFSLGTEHRWCEDPIESAPFIIIRDRAPMVQRTLLNLLRLLLLGTEHRWCEDPIESAPFIILIRAQARKAQGPIVFLRILFFFLFFIDYPGIFGGLNMVKNSWKFAHTLEPAAVRTPLRLGPGRGTEALQRPLEHHQKTWWIAHTYLHVFIWNSVHI